MFFSAEQSGRKQVRMCGDDGRPSPEAYKRNMALPMSRTRKFKLVTRNLSRRIYPKPATCCGNHGEPGC